MNDIEQKKTRVLAPFAALLLLLGLSVEEGRAQVAVGVQGNWASEADLGLGARVLANLGGSNFEVVGSADRFFPGNDREWWDFNANLFYHFHLADTHAVLPYLGGGLNVARVSTGNRSSTETGVNLGGGVRFPGTSLTPFFEVRAAITDPNQVVLTGGLLIGRTSFR
jgi:hypothetical protein